MAFVCSPESKAVHTKYWLLTQPLCNRNKNPPCELVMQSIAFIAVWAGFDWPSAYGHKHWNSCVDSLLQTASWWMRLPCFDALLWCPAVLTERILQLSAFYSSVYITVHIKGSARGWMMKPLCQRCREVTSLRRVCFAEVILPSPRALLAFPVLLNFSLHCLWHVVVRVTADWSSSALF